MSAAEHSERTTTFATADVDARACPKCRTLNPIEALASCQYRCVGCGLELAHLDMAANGVVRGLFGWLRGIGEIVQERYRVVEILGKGGFGVTYLVDDNRLEGKRRALKEIPTLLFDEYETRLLGRLNHPSIPDIIDRFEVGEMVYLVLEFGGSRTLRMEMDRQGGRIPIFVLLPWIEQVCAALIYLHSQDPPIVHRDLKPENILLDEHDRVMLIDFGIAKESVEQDVTRTIGRAVTHGFSPPEQVLGTGTDSRSDVYALGAILYCAITGQIPPAAHERITGSALEAPSRFFPAIPALLDSAICQALELNLNKRQQSITELADCLALVRTGGATAQTVMASDARTLSTRGVATGSVPLAKVEFPSTRASQRTAHALDAVPREPGDAASPRRSSLVLWVGSGLLVVIIAATGAGLYLLPSKPESVSNVSDGVPTRVSAEGRAAPSLESQAALPSPPIGQGIEDATAPAPMPAQVGGAAARSGIVGPAEQKDSSQASQTPAQPLATPPAPAQSAVSVFSSEQKTAPLANPTRPGSLMEEVVKRRAQQGVSSPSPPESPVAVQPAAPPVEPSPTPAPMKSPQASRRQAAAPKTKKQADPSKRRSRPTSGPTKKQSNPTQAAGGGFIIRYKGSRPSN